MSGPVPARALVALAVVAVPMAISSVHSLPSGLFACPEWVLVHLAGGLPAALGLAASLPRWGVAARIACVAFCVGLSLALPLAPPWDWGLAAVPARAVAAICPLVPAMAGLGARGVRLDRIGWCLALAWALLAGFMEYRFDGSRLERRLADQMAGERISEARLTADKLAGLGIETVSPAGDGKYVALSLLRDRLARQAGALEREAAEGRMPGAAVALARLGRTDEALAALADAGDTDPAIELLRGAFLQGASRYQESSSRYLAALRLANDSQARGDGNLADAMIARACRGLAFNSRRLGRPEEGARWYQVWMENVPSARQDALFQLALHWAECGRPHASAGILSELAADRSFPGYAAVRDKIKLIYSEYPMISFAPVPR